jgi:transposase InsO family protein
MRTSPSKPNRPTSSPISSSMAAARGSSDHRIIVVVEDCARGCLALIADTSISGIRVDRELDRLIGERGKPKMIMSDNGTELTSNAILQWADEHKVA